MVSFDLYGTIVDWKASIGGALSMMGVDVGEFFRSEFDELKNLKGFRPYSDILRAVLARSMGSGYRSEYGDALVLAFAKSHPFPDVLISLPRLKAAGYKLAVISNTERSLIGVTLCGMDKWFDWVVTAEDTGAYKPSPEAFIRAYEKIGVAKEHPVVHVSAYPSYDLVPASRLGLRTVLVNRYGDHWPVEVSSFLELEDVLKRLRA